MTQAIKENLSDAKIIDTVHPKDEMFHFIRLNGWTDEVNFSHYLTSGYLAWSHLKNTLEQFNLPINQIDSLLDFASGYGRNTRFMIQDICPSKITVSDLSNEMMGFQHETFGVNTIISNEDPNQFKLSKKFKVITCFSLFSHLPKKLFERWLAKLLDLLHPDGILLFSTHPIDHEASKNIHSKTIPHKHVDENSFLFFGSSETQRIASKIYGTTCVHPNFVKDCVNKIDSKRRVIGFGKNHIWHNQDLYVIGKKSIPFQEIDESGFIHGYLNSCSQNNGEVDFVGWAFFGEHRKPAEDIRVKVEDRNIKLIQKQLKIDSQGVADYFSDPRLNQCGFSAKFQLDELKGNKEFYIEASHQNIKHKLFFKFEFNLND